MRAGLWAVVVVLSLASVGKAADEPKPEECKKLYEDASAQLRAAQDRKAELAAENTKLTARIAELEKQLQVADGQITALRRETDGFAQRTFLLNSFYTAWESFSQRNPEVLSEWKAFMGQCLPVWPEETPMFRDPLWPFSARG